MLKLTIKALLYSNLGVLTIALLQGVASVALNPQSHDGMSRSSSHDGDWANAA